MSKWDGLNRRKFPRVNYPCLVVVKDKSDSGEQTILTHTENIGIGGVGLILKQNVKMFSTVELELDLLDCDEHVHCKGKVVWSVRRKTDAKKKPMFYDIGVEFDNLSNDDKERLKKIVERLVQTGNKVPYK